MERHAKERIVGAALIVALGVWLIPWVLDGPEDASEASRSPDDEILPAAGPSAPVRIETVELDPAPAASETTVRRAPAADPEPVAVVAPSPQGNAPSPEAGALSAQGNTPSAEAGAAAGGGNTARADGTPAAAAAPAASAKPPGAASPAGWMVQLGAFGDTDNAKQLAGRVSTYGYTVHVSEFRSGGQTMHRVRVGGFETESRADAAAGSLSAHGFPGRVIAPE